MNSRGYDLSYLSNSPRLIPQDDDNSNEPKNAEYDQEYLSQNDLVIGMNGKPIKRYLAGIEKRLDKPLPTI